MNAPFTGFPKLGRGDLIVCGTCRAHGNERTFKTPSGFKSHLENYHGAKNSDNVKVTVYDTKKDEDEQSPDA